MDAREQFIGIVKDAETATEQLMNALLRAKAFQASTHKLGRAYEEAGFANWKQAEQLLSEFGFKRARKDIKRLIKDAQMFDEEFVRKIGPSKLKAAARLKRAGRWNEKWEERFVEDTVDKVLLDTTQELRKIYEDRMWVRMRLQKSAAECWDALKARLTRALDLKNNEDVIMALDSFIPLDEQEILHWHATGQPLQEAA